MSSESSSAAAEVINSGPATTSLVSVNMVNVTKLCSTNYISWSTQIRSLHRGYDLLKFIDSTTEIPSPEIKTNSGDEEINPDYVLCQCQDSLLYSSIIGYVELAHQPLIASSTSSLKAWNTLMQTYAKPSRGHIKLLMN